MQKRHFELIAKTLKDARRMMWGDQQNMALDLVTLAFINNLRDTNELFKQDLFAKASGYQVWEPKGDEREECDDPDCWCKNEEHTGEFIKG